MLSIEVLSNVTGSPTIIHGGILKSPIIHIGDCAFALLTNVKKNNSNVRINLFLLNMEYVLNKSLKLYVNE